MEVGGGERDSVTRFAALSHYKANSMCTSSAADGRACLSGLVSGTRSLRPRRLRGTHAHQSDDPRLAAASWANYMVGVAGWLGEGQRSSSSSSSFSTTCCCCSSLPRGVSSPKEAKTRGVNFLSYLYRSQTHDQVEKLPDTES